MLVKKSTNKTELYWLFYCFICSQYVSIKSTAAVKTHICSPCRVSHKKSVLWCDQQAYVGNQRTTMVCAVKMYFMYLKSACNNWAPWIMHSVKRRINKEWAAFDQSCVSLRYPWIFQKVAHVSKELAEHERSRLMFSFFPQTQWKTDNWIYSMVWDTNSPVSSR